MSDSARCHRGRISPRPAGPAAAGAPARRSGGPPATATGRTLLGTGNGTVKAVHARRAALGQSVTLLFVTLLSVDLIR